MIPKISVIVPIYNVEKYLRECLDSILSQTFKNIEIICINDGSKDNSLKILNEYKYRDKRIIVINQKNKGYGAAINRGLLISRGRYIGIVEPDDYISKNMYERLFSEIKANEYDVVKANFLIIKNDKIRSNIKYAQRSKIKIFRNTINYPELFFGHPSIWAAIYKKEFLLKNNIKFIKTKGASFQDIPFWFIVLSDSENLKMIDDNLYFYRIHKKQSSSYIGKSNNFYLVFTELDNLLKKRYFVNKEKYYWLQTIRLRRSIEDYKCSFLSLPIHYKMVLFNNASKDFKNIKEKNILFNQLNDRERKQFYLIKNNCFWIYLFTLIFYEIRNVFGKLYDKLEGNNGI
jgi:glycosyltransferase involved in cell wall biosynthesis